MTVKSDLDEKDVRFIWAGILLSYTRPTLCTSHLESLTLFPDQPGTDADLQSKVANKTEPTISNRETSIRELLDAVARFVGGKEPEDRIVACTLYELEDEVTFRIIMNKSRSEVERRSAQSTLGHLKNYMNRAVKGEIVVKVSLGSCTLAEPAHAIQVIGVLAAKLFLDKCIDFRMVELNADSIGSSELVIERRYGYKHLSDLVVPVDEALASLGITIPETAHTKEWLGRSRARFRIDETKEVASLRFKKAMRNRLQSGAFGYVAFSDESILCHSGIVAGAVRDVFKELGDVPNDIKAGFFEGVLEAFVARSVVIIGDFLHEKDAEVRSEHTESTQMIEEVLDAALMDAKVELIKRLDECQNQKQVTNEGDSDHVELDIDWRAELKSSGIARSICNVLKAMVFL